MSGIAGILHPNGAPADKALAWALTRSLAFRGPDHQDVWCEGPIALGHALLRTNRESAGERQPAQLDGRFWIAADARLDARAELLERLSRAGHNPPRNAPDCELILRAYSAWGEDCLAHLRGDFAFAIWDARSESLFCARDHFGIKPFYYVESRDFFLFSNTLDCVRMHPSVSDELDESAIADFLLFGLKLDESATTFQAIRRLPPAHFLRVSAEGLRIARYWDLPVDGRIRYRDPREYVEHFRSLLRDAVSDRLGSGNVGVLLSGGLDSSSAAAAARDLLPHRGEAGKLRAYTATYEKTCNDADAFFAREAANFLGIPIRCLPMDDLRPFESNDVPTPPEPRNDPLFAGLFLTFQAIAGECRVAFDCEGPDNLMYFQMWPYVQSLLRNREWKRLGEDVLRFVRVRRIPWRGIRQRVKSILHIDPEAPRFPEWMNPDFAKRVDAQARWRAGFSMRVSPGHPMKPIAHASMSLPQWRLLFESQDAGLTGYPVETRYPFLDLRIVSYVLAIPPFPWAFQKALLREAMIGRLPENIRRRPKTPLSRDASSVISRRVSAIPPWFTELGSEMERFVQISTYQAHRLNSAATGKITTRPLCLSFWLQHSRPVRYNSQDLSVEACRRG